MKNHLISVALFGLLCLAGKSSYGQEITQIVKYSPLLNVGYERVLTPKKSVYVGASLFPIAQADITAFGIKGEYRFYTGQNKPAPYGFWVAPTALLWYVRFNDFLGESSGVGVVMLGGITGYQFIIHNRVSIEPCLGLGAGFSLGVNETDSGIFGGGVTPLGGLRLGLVLGK
ncbi:hypothetical protein GCM10028807_23670 [Spirosoma daeguense]